MQKDSVMSWGNGVTNEKYEKTNVKSQKRASSPLSMQISKKIKEEEYRKISTCEKSIQRSLSNQVELVERLVFKDLECQKLKKKFDEIDRNCRRWHDFAIGLQSRVKRLALILHRQQDTIKSLQTKDTKSVNVGVQTDDVVQKPKVMLNDYRTVTGITHNNAQTMKDNSHNTNILKIKQEKSNSIGVPERISQPSVFIDLTSEETTKSQSTKNNPQAKFNNTAPTRRESPVITKPCDTTKLPSNINFSSKNPMIAPAQSSLAYNNAALLVISNNTVTSQMNCSQISNLSTRRTSVQGVMDLKEPNMSGRKFPTLPVIQKNGLYSKSPPSSTGLLNSVKPYPALPLTPPAPRDVPKNALPSPPQPLLKIKKSSDGIELSWNHFTGGVHAKMDSYELYVHQHNPTSNAMNSKWKRIGNEGITAMPLPMACTLSQFSCGSIYYFAVRGKDIYGRYGSFSDPCCSSEVQR